MSSRSSGWRVDLERNFISITTNFEALGRADESPGCVVGGCAALTGITQQSLSQEGVREAEAWEDPGSLAFILGTALGWGKEIPFWVPLGPWRQGIWRNQEATDTCEDRHQVRRTCWGGGLTACPLHTLSDVSSSPTAMPAHDSVCTGSPPPATASVPSWGQRPSLCSTSAPSQAAGAEEGSWPGVSVQVGGALPSHRSRGAGA